MRKVLRTQRSAGEKTHRGAPLAAHPLATPTVCYMCSSECGLLVTVSVDGAAHIRGNPNHPMNAGGICPKAFLSDQLRRSPDRLTTPLKRVGPRGAGQFVPVPWDTALVDIGRQLNEVRRTSGAEALTILFGEKPDHDAVYEFAQAFGTPNVLDHNSLCDSSRRLGFAFTYGTDQERPLPDLQRPLLTDEGVRDAHDCRLLVLFGENPAEARRFYWLWDGIRQAQKEGMTLVALDPYKSKTAESADEWLPIKPGEDVALILAILRYVIEFDGISGSYIDWDFVREHTSGWEEVQVQILTSERDPDNGHTLYSVEWAAGKTGLPAACIADLAHRMGETKPACGMVGMNGVSHQYNGFQATRALAILLAVTGNIDVPGGLHLRRQPSLNRPKDALAAALGEQASKHKDLFGSFPMAEHGVFARVPLDILSGVHLRSGPFSGHSYNTRALMVIHSNPMLTAPDTPRWGEAFTATESDGSYALKLLVFNDILLNDTGLYADYVLPSAHFLERQGIVTNETVNPVVSIRTAAVPPPPGCRTPLEIYRDLAARVADGKQPVLLRMNTDDDLCDRILAPLLPARPERSPTEQLRLHGGVLSLPTAYRKYRSGGFRTGSGKVELIAGVIKEKSSDLIVRYTAGLVYEPIPQLTGLPLNTFRLITGRSLFHTHSITQNLDVPKRYRTPVLLMNHDDAVENGLASGDRVAVRTSTGRSMHATVEVTHRLRRGTLRGQHGWGAVSPFLSGKAEGTYNINTLMNISRIHPVSGNSCFGEVIVTVEKLYGE